MPMRAMFAVAVSHRFHLVSGMIQSAGAMAFLDPTLSTHTAMHDIFELRFIPDPTAATTSAAPKDR